MRSITISTITYDIPHVMVAWTHKTPRTMTAVSMQRSRAQGRFLESDEKRYAAVVPHLVRALEIRRLLHAARAQTVNAMAVINRMPLGVVFMNDSGRVAQVSLAAEALLRDGSAIVMWRGSIHAALSTDDARLQRAIQKTLRAKKDRIVPGDTVRVSRTDGRRPLTVAVVPSASECVFTPLASGCMLVVFDPDRSPRPALAAVRQVLRVSEAEAKLVCELFTGVTLREAAGNLQLTINTCKAQLKSIYAKTGCSSHVDLVKATFFAAATNGSGSERYE